jgi:hypothetical protein
MWNSVLICVDRNDTFSTQPGGETRQACTQLITCNGRLELDLETNIRVCSRQELKSLRLQKFQARQAYITLVNPHFLQKPLRSSRNLDHIPRTNPPLLTREEMIEEVRIKHIRFLLVASAGTGQFNKPLNGVPDRGGFGNRPTSRTDGLSLRFPPGK